MKNRKAQIFFEWIRKHSIFLIVFSCFSLSLISHSLSFCYSATLLGREAGLGDFMEAMTARQAGMGETKVAVTEDPTAVFYNPAQLAKSKKFNLIISPLLSSAYEKATHSDTSKSFNENSFTYVDMPLFAASYSFDRLTVAVGWGITSDFRYFHEDKTYLSGRLSTAKRAEDFGELRVLSGGASYRFQYCSLGISYLAYRGTPNFSYENLSYNSISGQIISSDIRTSNKIFGGRQVMGGVSIFPTDSLTIGAALKGRYTLSEDVRKVEQGIYGQTGRQWLMPWELGVGLSNTFSNLATKPTLAFDCVKKWWSQARVSTDGGPYLDAGFLDTLSYSIGMEHYLTPEIPFRYGLSFVPFYGRGDADLFTITLGSGYSWNWGRHKLSLELSGEYQIRSTSSTDRLFPEPADPQFPYINQDVVDTYVKRIVASVIYHF